MSENWADECSPRFNPEPWDGKTLTWENRRFLKDRVTSFFQIPLDSSRRHETQRPRDRRGPRMSRDEGRACRREFPLGADV